MIDANGGIDIWPSPVRSSAGHLFTLCPAPTRPSSRGRAFCGHIGFLTIPPKRRDAMFAVRGRAMAVFLVIRV